MKYTEYKLYDINDFNKFRSIEKATNPGKKAKGYIYGIYSSEGFKTGTLSVKHQSPYEYFSSNRFLVPDERNCMVILSEPHLNYKENLSIIKDHELYEVLIYGSAADYNNFKVFLGCLSIDGQFSNLDQKEQKAEKPKKKDIKISAMDKGDLYLYLHNQLKEIEKLNSIINESKAKRDEIHTSIKNAETRLKQLL